jgi:hypothetical protein
MPGARCARSRAWSVVNTRVSHRGHTGKRPAFPAQWFYGLFRALPGDRACLPPSSAEMASANLMPASGHQDHTTSPSASSALSSLAPPASIASRPAAVTIACRPSVGRDGGGYRSDLGQRKTGIFLKTGLDRGHSADELICPSGWRVGRLMLPASTASRPRVRDDRETPLRWARQIGALIDVVFVSFATFGL